ncbi:MAG: phosphatidylserine decarboxylase [Lachnospiraceae bacterium]|jgi:phosphatidylserine decarboxylase|nr:phosphatidylserine decarboxylase [Lachnospiraceae bacterium]
MDCRDREGNIIPDNGKQGKLLKTLYETKAGRQALKVLVQPAVSKAGSRFLDSRFSKCCISPFIEKSGIVMEEYEEEDYESYNQFFTRRIKEGRREFSVEPGHFCAPCDSRLSVYSIQEDGIFTIKNTAYTLDRLVKSKSLAAKYLGGTLCIFRLTVEDYHHYCYVDDGIKTKNYKIPGVFHTVNPLANDQYPVYTENTREFSILKSSNFGNILMMEVGAMLVGRIVNHHEKLAVKRGMEKGFFEFGGSTVVLAFQKGKVVLDADITANMQEGYETVVKMGEVIGRRDNGNADC